MNRWQGLGLIGLLLGVSLGAAPRMELVQSVPLETNLAVSGVRQAQEVWLEMIRGAQSTLDLEQFYVSDQAGEALEPVLQAIRDASARGVAVRLLVDKDFFKTYPDSVTELGGLAHAESRTIDFSTYGGVQHAKFFVVDGHNSFVGSQNFDWRALSHIHEIGIRVDDAGIASDLETIFAKDWDQGVVVASGGSREGLRNPPARPSVRTADPVVVASPVADNPDSIGYTLDSIVSLLGKAQQTAQIEVMEYTTKAQSKSGSWKVLDTAIRNAANRGVKVQLMVDVSDIKKAKAALQSLSAVRNISVISITIPPWSGGDVPYGRLIHAKFLVVDGKSAWVGSENWSESYFTDTRDVGLLTSDPTIISNLGKVFQAVWQSGYGTAMQAE